MTKICLRHQNKILIGCFQCQKLFCDLCREELGKCILNGHETLEYSKFLIRVKHQEEMIKKYNTELLNLDKNRNILDENIKKQLALELKLLDRDEIRIREEIKIFISKISQLIQLRFYIRRTSIINKYQNYNIIKKWYKRKDMSKEKNKLEGLELKFQSLKNLNKLLEKFKKIVNVNTIFEIKVKAHPFQCESEIQFQSFFYKMDNLIFIKNPTQQYYLKLIRNYQEKADTNISKLKSEFFNYEISISEKRDSQILDFLLNYSLKFLNLKQICFQHLISNISPKLYYLKKKNHKIVDKLNNVFKNRKVNLKIREKISK